MGKGKFFNYNSRKGTMFTIIRKAMSHYWLKRILPFLTLPGPIEIDETCIGRK